MHLAKRVTCRHILLNELTDWATWRNWGVWTSDDTRCLPRLAKPEKPKRVDKVHRITSDNYPVRLVQSNGRKANVLAAFKALLFINGSYDFTLLFEESYEYI
jgi:hypothetical protein